MTERAKDRAAGHDAVRRLLPGLCRCGGVEHIAMSKSRYCQLVLQFAEEVGDILSIAAATGTFKSNVASGFGNAKIDRIDERNSEGCAS
jgi:hypothetical protein